MKTIKLLLLLSALGFCAFNMFYGKSDSAIRDTVVKIKTDKGQCTGVQVKAYSGKSYILSAGHCLPLADKDGNVTVITEDNKILSRRVIQEDPASDLLLIEGLPDNEGLKIADKSGRFETIRTFTHGGGHDTYETRGLIVDDVTIGPVPTNSDSDKCAGQSKNMVIQYGDQQICALLVQETAMTAEIIPGSSGGPIVDGKGDLVGIASVTTGTMFFMVRLTDIKAFLHNY